MATISAATSLDLTVKNGDGCAFIHWSAVQGAASYDIQVKSSHTWAPRVYQRKATSCVITDLNNQENYLVQVVANKTDGTTKRSINYKIKPRAHLSVFDFGVKRTGTPGKMRLQWTPIPTNVGYLIERCDIGHANKYITVANIKDDNISTFEDQTTCDLTKLACAGHQYKISAVDATWLPNGSKSSAKVFCIRQPKVNNPALSTTANTSTTNPSISSSSGATTTTQTQDNNFASRMAKLFGYNFKAASSPDTNSNKSQSATAITTALPPQITTSAATAKPASCVTACKGDLITQQADVVVVCSSSQYLFDAICKAGGDSMKNCYNAELNKNSGAPVIAVKAEGQITSKMVYFLKWKADSDASILRKSIENFVSAAIERALSEKYQSIVFPAIGCGRFGCSVSLVAQTMIGEAHQKSQKHGISVTFVIQPERADIYDEFQKQINLLQQPALPTEPVKIISAAFNKGSIEVHMGDLTAQKVDVIIGSSSSQFLKESIINAAGKEVETAYNNEYQNNSNAILISTPPGVLPCKRIFFIKWQPDKDEVKLQQSLVDLIWNIIQNVMAYKFASLAFPAIGCGKHGCSVDVVVKTLVREMKSQLTTRDLSLTVKFVIQSDQQNIYDEFCKQVLATQIDSQPAVNYQLPLTWEKSQDKKMRFELSNTSDEYKTIVTNFDQAMKGKYAQIIRIERIQNERWYIQYLAHSHNFKTRLNTDTERRLYHGCPEQAVNSILEDCFNRSFAGVNGVLYGVGVYFSSNADYSHGYAIPNTNGERTMFVARVLIGNTTKGNSSMKTRPVGFDSTTDEKHIFVTYHDAQAYAEYLIIYK